MTTPAYRYLRGYCLDPGFSTRLDTAAINEVIYRIPYEVLEPGPVGEYIEVFDFDPASNSWYEPVDLSDEVVSSQNGLAPSEGSPQFHQQFVYTVAMKTIRHFEIALGRKVIWYPRKPSAANRTTRAATRGWEWEYVQRLRIYPHALREANAYYDPEKKALLFGYFTSAQNSHGTNYPSGLVFTCLSPDIVAHETTHAILDSLHHRYLEDTNPDVAAFHEGFADIVALLQRFTFRDLVEHQLYSSGGRLDRYTVLGELATQFGEAIYETRGGLRNMIGKWDDKDEWHLLKPRPGDYQEHLEAHDRGAVLVATVFDAFQRIYAFRTEDLFRIASNGTGVLPEGRIGRDLVRRLAEEAGKIAGHFLQICIRALDYCPPHDITFGDYLRALVTADQDVAPEDERGYRLALIEAFRARGIFPDRVNTFSPDSLRWNKTILTEKQKRSCEILALSIKPHVRELVEASSRKDIFDIALRAQAKLHEVLQGKGSVYGPVEWEEFLNKLGLTSRPVHELFGTNSANIEFWRNGKPNLDFVPPIEVHKVRPAFRAGPHGRQVEQVLITITQKVEVNIGTEREPEIMVFRGGSSIIMSLGSTEEVEFVVQKNIKSYARFSAQVNYQRGDVPGGPEDSSMYAQDGHPARISFMRIHQGM